MSQDWRKMGIDWTVPVIVLQLIFLEGILSIDNAAVLGALVTPLPSDRPVEWPAALRKLGDALHPVLGNQRMAALRVGLLGAYIGRGLMLFLASFVIRNPWLKLVGAAYLIRLAFENLGASHGGEGGDEENGRAVKETGFWMTVLTVEMMDLVFSLDNVVAAVSLSDKLWVVMLGVAIGILAMRFAAGVFSYLVEREPILKQAAYILVLNIGIELLMEDLAHIEISDWMRFGISAATILLTVAYSHIRLLRYFRPVLVWFSQGFSRLNALIDWLLIPIIAAIKLIFTGLKMVFSSARQQQP
jgi:tellurite resistance protein TerC